MIFNTFRFFLIAAVVLTAMHLPVAHSALITTSLHFTDPSKWGATLYYSDTLVGSPVIVIAADCPNPNYPYTDIASNLVAAGFFVVVVATPEDISSASNFRTALTDKSLWSSSVMATYNAILWVVKQKNRTEPFFDYIDTQRIGIFGYHFGGYVAATIAGAKHRLYSPPFNISSLPPISAVALLGTPTGEHKGIPQSAFQTIKTPLLSIFADGDFVGGMYMDQSSRHGAYLGAGGDGYLVDLLGADTDSYFHPADIRHLIVNDSVITFFKAYLQDDIFSSNKIKNPDTSPICRFLSK